MHKDDGTDNQARVEALLAELNAKTKIELLLTNGIKFPYPGKITSAGGKFDPETGNTTYRADFPNPDRLLRHGQTGTVLMHRITKDAIVIPQRAVFEVLDKRYVYILGKDKAVHQREIFVKHEMDDIFVLESGLEPDDRIVLEGVRQVREGEKVDAEFRKPEEVMANQKKHAE